MNANRSRSPLAYPLTHDGETAIPGVTPRYPGARGGSCAAAFPRGRPPVPWGSTTGTDSGPVPPVPSTDPLVSSTSENARRRPSAVPGCCERFRSPAPSSQYARLDGTDEGRPQVLVDRLLGDPERTTDPYGFQLAGVNQPIDGHLRYPHDRGYFGDGKESNVAKGSFACHHCPLPREAEHA